MDRMAVQLKDHPLFSSDAIGLGPVAVARLHGRIDRGSREADAIDEGDEAIFELAACGRRADARGVDDRPQVDGTSTTGVAAEQLTDRNNIPKTANFRLVQGALETSKVEDRGEVQNGPRNGGSDRTMAQRAPADRASDGHNCTVIHGESRTARTTVHLTPSDGHNCTVI